MKEVQLEETGRTLTVRSGKKIVFIHIGYDECAENPTKWDGFGKIHSFSRRHINTISVEEAEDIVYPVVCPKCGESGHDALVRHERGNRTAGYYCEYCGLWSVDCRVEQDSDCIPLGYFEHGNCIWHVTGDIPRGTEGDYRWDGVGFAGLWEPDEYVLNAAEELGLEPGSNERDAWMRKQAKSACETYTAWCNGWVYWYFVKIYKARQHNGVILDQRSDYRLDEPLHEDSCGGYYDTASLADEINDELKYGKVRVKVHI